MKNKKMKVIAKCMVGHVKKVVYQIQHAKVNVIENRQNMKIFKVININYSPFQIIIQNFMKLMKTIMIVLLLKQKIWNNFWLTMLEILQFKYYFMISKNLTSPQLTDAEFSILLDSFKTSQDLNWHIKYTILNQNLDILVEGIDLTDFSEGVAHIAKAIGVQTAQRYNFKWMDIQEMITYLTQEIKDGIPSSIQFIKLDKM